MITQFGRVALNVEEKRVVKIDDSCSSHAPVHFESKHVESGKVQLFAKLHTNL
jgi:hypothetical protein